MKSRNGRSRIGSGLVVLFSYYIRLRDAKRITGLITCCTCGGSVHWTKCHAGHYLHGPFMKTTYYEKNVHAQCRSCNLQQKGKKAVVTQNYRNFIIQEYGLSVLKYIHSLEGEFYVFQKWRFDKLYAFYKGEIKKILIKKSLSIPISKAALSSKRFNFLK